VQYVSITNFGQRGVGPQQWNSIAPMATLVFPLAPPNYGPNAVIPFQQVVEVPLVAQMFEGLHMPLVLPSLAIISKAPKAIVPTTILVSGMLRTKILFQLPGFENCAQKRAEKKNLGD
jgi:hypothetical protein